LAFIAANNKLQQKFLRGMRAAWAHFAQANYRSARAGSFFQLPRLFFPGIAIRLCVPHKQAPAATIGERIIGLEMSDEGVQSLAEHLIGKV
jgi:hypothetical protein